MMKKRLRYNLGNVRFCKVTKRRTRNFEFAAEPTEHRKQGVITENLIYQLKISELRVLRVIRDIEDLPLLVNAYE